MDFTLNEYLAKCKGYQEKQKFIEIQNESMLLWQAGAIAGMTWGKDFNPVTYWEARQVSKLGKKTIINDDDLIELAKEKGLTPPERW